MNKTEGFFMILCGLLIKIIFIIPFIQFIYEQLIRPLIHPNPIMKYHKKTAFALITGASEGVGKAFAEQLGEKGFNLILVARRQHLLDAIKEEIENKFKVEVITVCLDLQSCEEEEWNRLDQTLKEKNVTVLINNVGRSSNKKCKIGQSDIQTQFDVVKLNVEVTMRITHLFIQNTKQTENYLVVIMSSCTSKIVSPFNAVYSSTKAFLKQFGTSISYEYPNIDVTVFTPWQISTGLIGNLPIGMGIITPSTFVSSALKHVGLTNEIDPQWQHNCEDTTFYCLPSNFTSKAAMKEFLKFEAEKQKSK